jgi:FkbM family methyltransferase
MQLSFAQNLEDYHLAQIFAGEPPGTYIDVGAGHPVADNVSFHFYLQGWRGLVVEPQAELAALYAGVRPRDIAVQALVGRLSGTASFHRVERLHGFSTTLEEHARGAAAFGVAYETSRLPVITLAELCRRHGLDRIDFLKIDVEGAEDAVIEGNDWGRFRPRVVVAEAVEPGSMRPAWESFEPLLLAAGYRFAFFDRLNRFYVAEEAASLLDRVPAEPADWSAVPHLYEFGRAGENVTHPDRALADGLIRAVLARLTRLPPHLLRELAAEALGRPNS